MHLDGDKGMHDKSVCRAGVYDRAVKAIGAAKAKGFRVNINCTLFSDADAERVANFKATQEKFEREREEYFVATLENARGRSDGRPHWSRNDI